MHKRDEQDQLAREIFLEEAEKNMPDREKMLAMLTQLVEIETENEEIPEIPDPWKKEKKKKIFSFGAIAACLVIVMTVCMVPIVQKEGYADDFRKLFNKDLRLENEKMKDNFIPGEDPNAIIDKAVTLEEIRGFDGFEFKDPPYLPKGYGFLSGLMKGVGGEVFRIEVTYENEAADKKLFLSARPAQEKQTRSKVIDEEEGIVELVHIGDREYEVTSFAKIGSVTVEWQTLEAYYILDGFEPKEEMLKMAESNR